MDLEEVTWAGHKPGSAQLRTHRLSYSMHCMGWVVMLAGLWLLQASQVSWLQE